MNLNRLISGTTSVLIASALIGGVAPAFASASEVPVQTECSNITVIGARGSLEPIDSGSIKGFGDSVSAAIETLKSDVHSVSPALTFKYVPVLYPATTPFPELDLTDDGPKPFMRTYGNSVDTGVMMTKELVQQTIKECPRTKIILVGYSQGAQVLHQSLVQMTLAEHLSISRVWLIANPTAYHDAIQSNGAGGTRFFEESGEFFRWNTTGIVRKMAQLGGADPNSGGVYPNSVKDKIVEVCNSLDSFCALTENAQTLAYLANELMGLFTSVHGTVYKDGSFMHDAASSVIATDLIADVAANKPYQIMESVWDTTDIRCKSLLLPLSGAVDARVYWGDGSSTDEVGRPYHEYAPDVPSLVTVTIVGAFDHWGYGDEEISTSWSIDCLRKITRWGDTGTTSLHNGFLRANRELTLIENIPPGVTSIDGLFKESKILKLDISNWDTSNITSMRATFQFAQFVNSANFERWDVSSVTDMSNAFRMVLSLNHSIIGWNTSSVTNMNGIFWGSMNMPPLRHWNVSNVTRRTCEYHATALILGFAPNFADKSGMSNLCPAA